MYYPLPKSQNLLLLALNGNSKDPENCLEVVKLVLPFVGGKEVGKAWKKVEWEQVKKRRIKKAMEKWGVWEEVKWLMAERMQALDFEEVSLLVPESIGRSRETDSRFRVLANSFRHLKNIVDVALVAFDLPLDDRRA